MARKPPPEGNRFKPGQPKPPNSGRKPGTPNKLSEEVRTLISRLLHDPLYQQQLRKKFQTGTVDPRIESLIWQLHLGKPVEHVQLDANVTTRQKLEAERERLLCLDEATLKQLVEETDALIERAIAKVKARAADASAKAAPRPPVTSEVHPPRGNGGNAKAPAGRAGEDPEPRPENASGLDEKSR